MRDFEEGAQTMIEEMRKMDNTWRDEERVRMVQYGIMAGYQLALWRALGNTPAFTQMLLGEVGDLLLEVLSQLGVKLDYGGGHESLEDVLRKVFLELGVAREVEVRRLEDTVKHGRRMVRYEVVLRDSVFKPVHLILYKRGMKSFTISPEALIAGAVLRRLLKEANANARVNVKTEFVQEGDGLRIILEEILPLE